MQNLHVSRLFPHFSYHHRKGGAVWRGTLQPREPSPYYQIEIRYKLGEVPKVRVIRPPLAKGCPHLYNDESLCLFWPKEWAWEGDEIIAKTILPWTALWLYYYELWLDCGKWLGPSSHDVADRSREEEKIK